MRDAALFVRAARRRARQISRRRVEREKAGLLPERRSHRYAYPGRQ